MCLHDANVLIRGIGIKEGGGRNRRGLLEDARGQLEDARGQLEDARGQLEDVGIHWRMWGSTGGCVGPLEDVWVHWRM